MAKILIVEGGKVTPLDDAKFTDEGKLQGYLEEYPSLFPLEEIDETAPKLLCIGREIGAGPGSIDLLYIDQNGLLTVVETKLAKNPEARRTVIGQIIEYASYVSEWTADKVEEVASAYLKSDLYEFMRVSPDVFRDSIEQNLRKGNFRLIIAVDELVEPLRKTVTYLNSHSAFNILLLLVKRFEEKDRKDRSIFVPSLFGYTPPPPPPPGGRHYWNEPEFLEDVNKNSDKRVRDTIRKLLEFTKANGKVKWGTGTVTGSFTFNEPKMGLSIFSVYSNGSMSLNAGWMLAWQKVKQKEEILDSFRTELNQIPEINTLPEGAFYETGIDALPPQTVQFLTQVNNLEQFEKAVLSLCQRIEVED